jgi:predicted RNase H-like nuclease (RuvC/YqgF family)
MIFLCLFFLACYFNHAYGNKYIEDKFRLYFKESLYEKSIPTTSNGKQVFIKELELMTNDLIKKIEDYSNMIGSMEQDLVNLQDSLSIYLNDIKNLSYQIDSLTQIIKENELSMKEKVDNNLEKVNEKIEKLDIRPIFNFGLSGGMSWMTNGDGKTIKEITLVPQIAIKRLEIGAPIGLEELHTNGMGLKIGVSLGWWFK